MTNKNRAVLRAVCFALLFSLVWMALQYVFAYKWTDSNEMPRDRYSHFEAEPPGTIDMLVIGSSALHGNVNPAIVYHTSGITSYNFAMDYGSAFHTYYTLRYALKHQTPRLLVLDLSDIHKAKDPREMDFNRDSYKKHEISYRKCIENMPDLRLRLEMLLDYEHQFGMGDTAEYLLPLMRYHDRWQSLSMSDFLPGAFSAPDYQPFLKGACMRLKTNDQSDLPEFTRPEKNGDIPEISLTYYSKVMELCRENGIEVLVVASPQLVLNPTYLENAARFCEENGVNLLSYPGKDAFHAIGIDEQNCFEDENHLNIRGQLVFSRVLAREIQSLYGLKDHREDPAYAAWDEAYAAYYSSYGAALGADAP